MQNELDDRDQAILAERLHNREQIEGPRVGDVVIFKDDVVRRIAYDWGDRLQTCDGGSFYLNESGTLDMSGSLYVAVPKDSLTPTEDTRRGSVWFFHHNWHTAGGGIWTQTDMRVYRCSLDAPKS